MNIKNGVLIINVEVLGGLLKRIDNFNPHKFGRSLKDRILFQKTVYLLQEFVGTNLGYHHSWYIYGPYSSKLADAGYELSTIYDNIRTLEFKDPDVELRFKVFIKFLGNKKNDTFWLELIASIIFLRREWRSPKIIIFRDLQQKRYEFNEINCQEAWDYLEKWGLV